METGTDTPSAAPPTDAFAAALAAFTEAHLEFVQARDTLELAQTEQAAAVNALPEDVRADMAQHEAIADRLQVGVLGTALFDAMGSVRTALAALMAEPAKTISALADKLEAAASSPWDEADHLLILADDARRLAGMEARHEA